jgi:hypothetical protein
LKVIVTNGWPPTRRGTAAAPGLAAGEEGRRVAVARHECGLGEDARIPALLLGVDEQLQVARAEVGEHRGEAERAREHLPSRLRVDGGRRREQVAARAVAARAVHAVVAVAHADVAQRVAAHLGELDGQHHLRAVARRVHGHPEEARLGPPPHEDVRLAGAAPGEHHVAVAHDHHVGHRRVGHRHARDGGAQRDREHAARGDGDAFGGRRGQHRSGRGRGGAGSRARERQGRRLGGGGLRSGTTSGRRAGREREGSQAGRRAPVGAEEEAGHGGGH